MYLVGVIFALPNLHQAIQRVFSLHIFTATCSKVVPLKNEGADYCHRYFHCSAQKENKVLVAVHGRYDERQPVEDDGNNEPTTETTNIQRTQPTYNGHNEPTTEATNIQRKQRTYNGHNEPTTDTMNLQRRQRPYNGNNEQTTEITNIQRKQRTYNGSNEHTTETTNIQRKQQTYNGNNETTKDTTNIQWKQRTYNAQVGIAHLESTSAADVIPTAEYINSSTLNLNLQHKLTTYIV